MLIEDRIYHRDDGTIIAVGVHITLDPPEQTISGDDLLTVVREEVERAAHAVNVHVDLPNVRMKRLEVDQVLALCRRVITCAAGHRHVVGPNSADDGKT